MVSPNIQGLGLSDKLLEHYRKEVGEMAVGILDGKPFDSPIHMGILLTCMFEILPYDDSDKSEFSHERFHSYMSKLNDEIIEERGLGRSIQGALKRHHKKENGAPNSLTRHGSRPADEHLDFTSSSSVLLSFAGDIRWR